MSFSLTSFMKNQRQARFCFCLVLGISLMVFPGFSLCSDTSSFPSELGISVESLEPELSDGNFRHNSKYIMKSYYEKYKSLDDSNYKEFTALQLPFGLCDVRRENSNIVPRLLALERKLIGEGSHRRLSSAIRISIEYKATRELLQCDCAVIAIEKLPLGVFADPFELQHLIQRGVFNDIAVFGDTNLESPSFLSNRSAVEIHIDVSPDISTHMNEIDIKFELPLHARYAPLNETGYSQVRFDAPDLFLQCTVEGKSWNRSCLYKIESDSAKSQNSEIVWKVPSGIDAHAGIVYAFTFITASLAALVIVLTSICHSSFSRCKSLKQS